MISELADILVLAGQEKAFEAAVHRGVTTVISRAKGFSGYEVSACIETPSRYILLIQWETLENHTVDFRGGPLFGEWRAIVGPFFAHPPKVEHFKTVIAPN